MVHEKSRLQGFQKTYVGRLFSGYLKYPLSWGFLRVLGAWMTFKKADMAKTLKTRFSMIETNPLNHKWLDFVILTGLALHQFQTNWLLSNFMLSQILPIFFSFYLDICNIFFQKSTQHQSLYPKSALNILCITFV